MAPLSGEVRGVDITVSPTHIALQTIYLHLLIILETEAHLADPTDIQTRERCSRTMENKHA